MTLKFESLSIWNFGPYQAVDELALDTTPNSPVVVIFGENTLGKTSLFRAIRWCLYGTLPSGPASLSSLKSWFNRPALAAGADAMSVSLVFSAEGRIYHLTRSAYIDGDRVSTSADLTIDASAVAEADIPTEIARVLHPQISDFFLFDGEMLHEFYDRLNSNRERDILRESINSVLGVPALQLALHDLSNLTQDVLERQARAIRDSDTALKSREKVAELKSKMESLEKDRREIRTSMAGAVRQLDEVKAQIAGVSELRADAREMEIFESQIEGGRNQEVQLRDRMKSLIGAGWLAPLERKLSVLKSEIESRNDASRALEKERDALRDRISNLQALMDEGVCPVCERPFESKNSTSQEEIEVLRKRIDELEALNSSPPDHRAERLVATLVDDRTRDQYREKQAELDQLTLEQFQRRRHLEALKDRLRENDAAAIRQLGSEHDRLERVVEQYRQSLRALDAEQATLSQEQQKIQRAITKLGGTSLNLEMESEFFQFVKMLFGHTIERYQEKTRQAVETGASNTFLKLVRDPDAYGGLKIESDYRVLLIGKEGQTMNTSEGGKQLVALSLIGALKREAVRGGAVILDSPLARLDLEHRENVLQTWLPSLGDQAILLVQSGELTQERSREILGTQVGRAYRIHRPGGSPEVAEIQVAGM